MPRTGKRAHPVTARASFDLLEERDCDFPTPRNEPTHVVRQRQRPRRDAEKPLGRPVPANVIGKPLVDRRRDAEQAKRATRVEERVLLKRPDQGDVRIGVDQDVFVREGRDGELGQLLHEPASHRRSARAQPDVLAQPVDLQAPDAARQQFLGGHDASPRALETAERGQIVGVDDDPVTRARRQ